MTQKPPPPPPDERQASFAWGLSTPLPLSVERRAGVGTVPGMRPGCGPDRAVVERLHAEWRERMESGIFKEVVG